eukprot:538334-Rhodomonas_salina.1
MATGVASDIGPSAQLDSEVLSGPRARKENQDLGPIWPDNASHSGHRSVKNDNVTCPGQWSVTWTGPQYDRTQFSGYSRKWLLGLSAGLLEYQERLLGLSSWVIQ